MQQVATTVQELNARGLVEKAKQAVQVEGIAEKLEGEIQKLSSLVEGLKVRVKLYCRTVKFSAFI